jgi:2'-5' RNA ligase
VYDDDHDDIPESGQDWRRPRGIFIIAPLGGPAGEKIAELQRKYDPKLASLGTPHVTVCGSSGTGPIAPGAGEQLLREKLESIARSTAPLSLKLGRPQRFMQTNIVSLPLDPHGPLRDLHESIKASGLRFLPARFAFSPHATISYFPTLSRQRERELLSIRVDEPVRIDRLELSLTNDPQPPKILFSLALDGFRSD